VLETTILILLGIFLLGGSLMVIWSKYPPNAVIGLFSVLLSVAGLFAVLGNGFLFLAQVMVTVGAVVVLTLIVMLGTNMEEKKLPREPYKALWTVISAVAVAPFGWLLYRELSGLYHRFEAPEEALFSTKALGKALFSDWVLPFEILSLLLLAAMVGAIVIGKKEQSYDS